MQTRAVVLLSGGLDSAVILGLALDKGRECFAISFDYSQKHIIELESAKKIAQHYRVQHRIIKIDPTPFAGSSLVSHSHHSLTVPKGRSLEEIASQEIPSTYVPARNTLFIAHALGYAETLKAQEIHFGPNLHDYNSYVDCRPEYIAAYQNLINLSTKQALEGFPPKLVAPLIQLKKHEIIQIGIELKVPLDLTFSCYSPTHTGSPCGLCDACTLRSDAFRRAAINTPLSSLERAN